jgi:hypothetical protein
MSEIEIVLALMFVLLAAGVSIIAIAFHLRSRQANHSDEDPSVRDKAHEAANEATVVKHGLRRLASEPDPLSALVEAIHGCQREQKRRRMENGR